MGSGGGGTANHPLTSGSVGVYVRWGSLLAAITEGKMKIAPAIVLGIVLLITACSSSASDGPVTTAEEAVTRARTAWKSVGEKASWHVAYRKESTAKFEPYTATLENGVWIVRRTVPSGYRGEVLETRVRQIDGQVSVEVAEVK